MRYAYGFSSLLLAGGAALSLITGHPAGAQTAQNDASSMNSITPRAGAPASFADLTEQLQPAVVNISTKQRVTVNNNPFAGTPFADLFGQRGQGGQPQTRETQSLGSGFIISGDGYVVTNNHVITANGRGEVSEITVRTADGTEYEAELVGADAASDLAVLKIDSNKSFPFVQFGDTDQPRVGDWVIAIGNPFGLGGTVTSGIVSSVLRTAGGGAYDRYIQTDASINSGNSGGPLFNMRGNVIGVNNAILSPSGGNVGIGFAIPADTAKPIVDKLIAGEEIARGYLGVRIQPVNEDLADSLGIAKNRGEFIQSVEPDQAADKAGLKAGDVVTAVNGQEVTPDQTLSFLVANIEPGTRVPIDILRSGEKRTITATVGKRPSEQELASRNMFGPDGDDSQENDNAPADASVEESLGVQVVAVTPQIANQLGASRDTQGVAITAVDPTSDAAQKGLRRRDIILSANNRDVSTPEELTEIVAAAKESGREAVLLRVQRRGQPATFIAVRLK